MAGAKVYRLSKLAREFNVSVSTIVDFLGKKGHEVDTNPNTKVPGDLYGLLVKEYQAEKKEKEASKNTELTRSKRETVSIDDSKESEEKVDDESKEKDHESELLNKKYQELVEKQNASVEKSNEDKKPVIKEVNTDDSDDTSGDVKVIGKINLDEINAKTRPAKKEKPKKETKTPAQPTAKKEPNKKVQQKHNTEKEKKQKAKQEAIALLAAEKKALDEKKARKEAKDSTFSGEQKKEVETIKTSVNKLSGPTVLGKIELPVEKKKEDKKKIHAANDRKKKRKRIKKVSETDAAKTTTTGGAKAPAGPRQPNPRSGNGKGPRGSNHRNALKPGRRNSPVEKKEISQEDVQKEIKETLAKLSGGGKSKTAKLRREKRDTIAKRKEKELEEAEAEQKVLKVSEFVTVSELATMMDVSVTDIISSLMSIGIFASINQRLDAETLTLVAEDYGFEVEFISAELNETIEVEEDPEGSLIERSPIVTVMGHVDHGKTSLLDYVRKTNVIGGEAGGITQHIGAYNVELENGKKITFLDTPGHEAFTAMRARGAQVTDVAIIIIAADDSIMPQTKEAINHAQAAGVPMIFAINKIDKPGANPDKVREALSAMNILVEEWGGKYQCQEISAKSGLNIDLLLEKVVLESEMLELKANPDKRATGTIIEASLDKGKGFVTTLIVQSGTMRTGDVLLAGSHSGKVRAMFNERGKQVKEAGPSMPVSILGLSGAPNAGDNFNIMSDEREARNIANKRLQIQREQGIRTQKHITLDEIGRRLAIGNFKELNVIVKGDVDGSIEALSDSLQKLSTDEIQVNIIHKAVGQISESDVLLATASDAIIIGFQVRPSTSARKLAEAEEIDIRLYSIIYKAIEELKLAMEGMLSPDIVEEIVANVEVRDVFKITKVGTVAGCYVMDGKISRNSKIRLIREGIVIYEGALGQLKRFKDDVKEVKFGYECGLSIEKFNDLKVGDVIEAFEEKEVKRKL